MVSSISNVGYRPNVSFGTDSMAKVSPELMNAQQVFAYSGEGAPVLRVGQEPEKKGSFLGGLVKTAIGLAIVAGGAIVARRKMDVLKNISTEELAKDAKFMDKVKHYFAKATDWVDKYTWKKAETWNTERKAANTAKETETSAKPTEQKA